MQHLHNQVEGSISQDLKDKVEAIKTASGTFQDLPSAGYSIKERLMSEQPILGDELVRLRNRVSYLEGYTDGMKYALGSTKPPKEDIK